MTNEFILLQQKVDEFDAFISENLDISNPLDFYGTDEKAPKTVAVEKYRMELTALMGKVSAPKTPEESLIRRRALVQIQFIWVLMDIAFSNKPSGNVQVFSDNPELRYKCICLGYKQGEMLSKSIDFDTITWIRTIDSSKITEQIEKGIFKGKLNPGPDSVYYGLQNCEVGPQLVSDFCIYDIHPEITSKLYVGENSLKFVNERKYALSAIKGIVKLNETVEKYWFMHILDPREEMLFRIRFINAFRDNLRILYASECMQEYSSDNTDSNIAEINYRALKSRGVSELIRAYKAMYDLSGNKAIFVFRGRTEESNRYMNAFVGLYREIKDTLVTDKSVLNFQRTLLSLASKQEFGEYFLGLVNTFMNLSEDSQKEIMKSFEGDSSLSLQKFEQKMLEITEAEINNDEDSESHEDFINRMTLNVNEFLAVHKKLEDSYNEKLGRYAGVFSDRFRNLVEETLSDPDQTLEIAYENKL